MSDESRTVLFICHHGAAKSVLAAADLRTLATNRGIRIAAQAAGTEPDQAVLPAVIQAVGSDEGDFAQVKPHRVTQDELLSAWRVITFNLEPIDLPADRPDAERWDDVPAVSEDFLGAREAIGRHLDRLIEDLDR